MHRLGFLGLFGPSVDSLNHYLENFAKWNLEVQSLRRQPANSSSSSVAFVTFDAPKTAVNYSRFLSLGNRFSDYHQQQTFCLYDKASARA
jgi:hypothetical protein